jgi:hypothetical protein
MNGIICTYNSQRLRSFIGYIAPLDKLNRKEEYMFNGRDQMFEVARTARKQKCPAFVAPASKKTTALLTSM